MSPDSLTRRRMLGLTGAAATVALAGCSQGGTDSTPADGSDSGGSDSDESGDGAGVESFDGWFDGVDDYDGVEDLTGRDEVTVDVGAGDGGVRFDPPAIRVSSGTTVVWEWTGAGGAHNVVDEDGAFESELVGEPGHTFEHAFEDAGTSRYYCNPHQTMGMKGAVVVE